VRTTIGERIAEEGVVAQRFFGAHRRDEESGGRYRTFVLSIGSS